MAVRLGMVGSALLVVFGWCTAVTAQDAGSSSPPTILRPAQNNPEPAGRTVPDPTHAVNPNTRGTGSLTHGWWLNRAQEDGVPVRGQGYGSAGRGGVPGNTDREASAGSRGRLDSLVRIRERRLERAEKLREIVRKGNGRTNANSGSSRSLDGVPATPLIPPQVEVSGAPTLESPENAVAPAAATARNPSIDVTIDLPDDLTAPPKPKQRSRGLFSGTR